MDDALDLAAIGGLAIGAFRVIRAANGRDVAVLVLVVAGALDREAKAQPHLAIRSEAEELLWRLLHEVRAIDPGLTGERHLARAGALVRGVVLDVLPHDFAGGPVFDDQFDRVEHGHAPPRARVEVVPREEVEQAQFVGAVDLGDADVLAERDQCLGGHAATTQAANCRHSRIVPAIDVLLFDQAQQLALAGQHVFDVEAGELDLLWMVNAELLAIPVIERPMVLELEGAQRVRHAFDRIALAVRPVIHRVDAPLVAGALVVQVADPIHRRIAQVEVGVRHVDLGAQHLRAVGELTGFHAAEQVEVVFDRTVAERAVGARGMRRATALGHLFGGLVVDVGQALFDQLLGPGEQLAEVVGRVDHVVPFEAEPAHVLLDGVDILLRLLLRVGVVHAQIALAAELLGYRERQRDRLGMADVQVAVRFRWEARLDLLHLAFLEIRTNAVSDEVGGGLRRGPVRVFGISRIGHDWIASTIAVWRLDCNRTGVPWFVMLLADVGHQVQGGENARGALVLASSGSP